MPPWDSRRSLRDLSVLHKELEPGLRDIYVESRADAMLFRTFLKEMGVRADGVYPIDDRAIVDSDIVREAGGEVGPRGRLIGLASVVTTWGLDQPGITCVVDADRDGVFGGPTYPDLLKTDGGSVEVYAFAPRPLQRFLHLVLGRDVQAEQLIAMVSPALRELFLIRAVLHLHGPRIALVPKFTACCEFGGHQVDVDSDELISRSLAAASAGSRRGVVLSHLETARQILPLDERALIRGHDIAPMLVKVLDLKNDWAKVEFIEKALRVCLRVEDLQDEPLFVQIRDRLT